MGTHCGAPIKWVYRLTDVSGTQCARGQTKVGSPQGAGHSGNMKVLENVLSCSTVLRGVGEKVGKGAMV